MRTQTYILGGYGYIDFGSSYEDMIDDILENEQKYIAIHMQN